MYNISGIFTRHQEIGICNSFELLKIVEKISPEIIFEELQYSVFNEIYKEKGRTTLETNTIKKYLQSHSIKHIPVDTYDQPKSHEEECYNMLNKVSSQASMESFQYRGKIDHLSYLESHFGFDFLNSDQNDKILEEIDILKERILKSINDENLFRIATLEKEIVEKRENRILDNIYNFSKEHLYKQALLFIGSAHRKSIIKKIKTIRKQEKLIINWSLLGSSF
ncbi:hypothetical protein VOI54_03005 [Tamlana sp. 2201CG12-4]|uniref:hypothetical protein n=1 Tax=Tamlana sp. 2201CG12-4 TaxID=3112582 RepID=UPI002DBC87C5|nr:hypothetical protein [Tamlana sp. 2201CG12-4]MEC3905979.1 hypothetical protein [Tamlana sp. 2201CG12-4]